LASFRIGESARDLHPPAAENYREIKSRNSMAKDFGGRVQVNTNIATHTCHPHADVVFHRLATPPTWHRAECDGVLLIERP
jgi:hypothetical protein